MNCSGGRTQLVLGPNNVVFRNFAAKMRFYFKTSLSHRRFAQSSTSPQYRKEAAPSAASAHETTSSCRRSGASAGLHEPVFKPDNVQFGRRPSIMLRFNFVGLCAALLLKEVHAQSVGRKLYAYSIYRG